MKDTDKVTVTISQLKKLIKESNDQWHLFLHICLNGLIHNEMNIYDGNKEQRLLAKWVNNQDSFPYLKYCESILKDDDYGFVVDQKIIRAIKQFYKNLKAGINTPMVEKIKGMIQDEVKYLYNQISDNINREPDPEEEEIYFITYNDILDVLKDFDKEDIEDLAGMDPSNADDMIYGYIDIPSIEHYDASERSVENIDHIGYAAVEMAQEMVDGKSIAKLRKEYGKHNI